MNELIFRHYHNLPAVLLLSCILCLLSGCSTLSDLSRIQKPAVSVEDVRVTDFNFNEMELTYDVKVKNPNAVEINMLAYDYNLDINKNTLVKGEQQKGLEVKPSGESTFQIPMKLNFQDFYTTIENLSNTDEASYNFLSNLTFELPVLGKTQLPIQKQGQLPVLKMPKISIQDWSLGSLSFSGAEVNVQLAFDNPNNFDININSLDYNLMINGDQWAQGTALQGIRIKKKDTTTLRIPISVNLSQMGMSAYRMLSGSEPFDYRITGTFDLNILHQLLGQTTFDFDRSGELSLSR